MGQMTVLADAMSLQDEENINFTAGVVNVLRGGSTLEQVKALAAVSREGGFNDPKLRFEAMETWMEVVERPEVREQVGEEE